MTFQAGVKTESGYLAVPASGGGPGVLVLHAWWGLNGFFVSLCDRLAREGFVALAPDLYGGAIAASEEEAESLKDAHGAESQEKVWEALRSLKSLQTESGTPVATIGFSLGAYWAAQLASQRPDDVAAVVLFYGLSDPDFSVSRAAYLGHFAENDTWEPIDQVRIMESDIRAAGRDVTFYVYPDVGHWFFEADRPDAFHAESAELAWERTTAFLREKLSGE